MLTNMNQTLKEYRKTFISELYTVRYITGEVMNFLEKQLPDLTTQDSFELKLIFNELLVNAVVHGNKNDITKRVTISIEIHDNTICAKVRDEGHGFNYIDFLHNQKEDNIYSEHGRGIRLVYSLADDLLFNSNGNEIKFFKKVEASG